MESNSINTTNNNKNPSYTYQNTTNLDHNTTDNHLKLTTSRMSECSKSNWIMETRHRWTGFKRWRGKGRQRVRMWHLERKLVQIQRRWWKKNAWHMSSCKELWYWICLLDGCSGGSNCGCCGQIAHVRQKPIKIWWLQVIDIRTFDHALLWSTRWSDLLFSLCWWMERCHLWSLFWGLLWNELTLTRKLLSKDTSHEVQGWRRLWEQRKCTIANAYCIDSVIIL